MTQYKDRLNAGISSYKFLYVLVPLFLMLGLFSTIFNRDTFDYQNDGILILGEIVEVEIHNKVINKFDGASVQTYFVAYGYDVNGVHYVSREEIQEAMWIRKVNFRPQKGAKVAVLYNPKKPKKSIMVLSR
jgi:hypothetical protein